MAAKTVALVIDLQIKDGGKTQVTVNNLAELKKVIKDTQAQFANTDFGTAQYNKLDNTLKVLQSTLKAVGKDGSNATQLLSDAQRQLNGEVAKAPGHYRQLQTELTAVKNRIKDLSKGDLFSGVGSKLISDANKLDAELKSLDERMGVHTRKVGDYAGGFKGAAAGLSSFAAKASGILAALQGGSEIINTTREVERLQAVLKVAFRGDTNAANSVFAQIKSFASTTPNSLNDVTEAFLRLKNAGLKPTIPDLAKIGDVAASQGKNITQYSEAIADAVIGQNARLNEFGIDLTKSGNKIKATFQGQTTIIDNSADAIKKYLIELGNLPGVAGGSLAISQTLDGAI